MKNPLRYSKLKQMQLLPLREKINASKRRIREWLSRFPEAKVSFSGGKDSTVLLHLARQVKPNIIPVFCNTGLEYPEIVEFVKQVKNVEITRPKLNFLQVIEKYGYPVVSKRVSKYIHDVRNTKSEKVKEIRNNGPHFQKIPDKWKFLLDAPFKISDKCCYHLKIRPLNSLDKTPFVGTMATESEQRQGTYLQYGCNAFDLKRPISRPLSFWTEKNIWDYIRLYNVPYSKIYDMGYERTGCMFCMFGYHLQGDQNKFDLMKKTHPQLYNWCMYGQLKLNDIIDYVHYRQEREERKKWDTAIAHYRRIAGI